MRIKVFKILRWFLDIESRYRLARGISTDGVSFVKFNLIRWAYGEQSHEAW